jgi:hypothetical protein
MQDAVEAEMIDLRSGSKETNLGASLRTSAEMSFASYDAALGSVAPLLAAAEEDCRLARQLVAMPPIARVEAAAYNRRFRRVSLARMMVLQAEAALFEPGGDPRLLAELGTVIAGALAREVKGGGRRTAALGSWLLGKGLLRSWHRRLAREAFRGMGVLLREGEISEEAGLMSAGLAQFHEDIGDVEGATACWLRSASVYSRLGAAQPVAACHAQLGLLLVESGDLVNARFALGGALRLIDAAFTPSLTARVRLAMAEIEAGLGDPGGAREQVERARKLYALAPAPAEGIERSWREGRIAAASRQDGEAERQLGAARVALLRGGSLREAARVTLDQVLLRIGGGAGAGVAVAELTAPLAAVFAGAGEKWAADMEAMAQRAAAKPEESYRESAEMRTRLRRIRRADPRWPPLLTSSRMLGDRLLRGHGEQEDAIGAAKVEVQ